MSFDIEKKKMPIGLVIKTLAIGVVLGQLFQPLPVQWNGEPLERASDMYEMASAYGLDYLSEVAPEETADPIISLADGGKP